MTAKPTNHVVAVFQKGPEYKVAPGELVAKAGDTVTFVAIQSEATLFFPQFPEQRGPLDITRGVPGKISLPDGIPPGVYYYAAFGSSCEAFARGGSDPVIIIRGRIPEDDEG